MGVCGWSANVLVCKSSGHISTLGSDRVKDCFSVLFSDHLCRLIGAYLTLVCTAYTKTFARVKDPLSIF